ncbi:MAG TPA: branched-chain amino acid ABC transporter permease [Alphaproteobacteria bacterium]|nr:branched-chain amino acid ABC transporter permease [Alphaproteobacteria bacterium]
MLVAQLLVNGIALGAAYALCTLGFVLVLNATGAVNFAQGDMVTAGGLTSVAIASVLPLPAIVLMPAVVVAVGALGVIAASIAYLPLKNRPTVAVFISTIALGVILQNTMLAAAGPAPHAAPPLISTRLVRLYGVALPLQSLAVICFAVVVGAGLFVLLYRTRLGQKMRATAQDRTMAAALGVDVVRIIILTFALAAALGGAAGVLLANTFFVTPFDGGNYILKAYIAATIGGWGSIAGAVAGALLIALFEVLFPALPLIAPSLARLPAAAEIFSQTSAAIALYVALLAILMLRPQGLFGDLARRRA